jgi:hypothetical protein
LPDGFHVKSFAGDDWRDCRAHVCDRLGVAPHDWRRERTPTPRPKSKASDEVAASDMEREAWLLARAAAIFDESLPLSPIARDYFTRRKIPLGDVPDDGGLRWHPKCPWGGAGATAPCIVARYTDAVTAEPRGIWRRPLTGEKPRGLGPNAGCVIRLWPDDSVEYGLVLGEGVETTLAAATRIVHRGTYLRPAWAAGSAGNMGALPVLAGVESLTLLVDRDRSGAGERAAEQCARRWIDSGREVTRLTPRELGDFNDLVRP